MNPTSPPAGPAMETRSSLPADLPGRARRRHLARAVEAFFLVVATIFLALHAVHLKADFPNRSDWSDWAKYTDEGWYGDAAIRHYQLGHWYVPGDFNPAVALPVWPAIEAVLFRATGVSLVAVRALTVAVFGLSLLCCALLIRRWSNAGLGLDDAEGGSRSPSPAPAIAVLLLAVSPFCYAFSRLAILEPLLILLTLAAMLVASEAGASALAWSRERTADRSRASQLTLRFAVWAVALGLLLPLMVLTKTTGVFLFPAVLWLLWASSGYRLRPFSRVVLVAGGVGAAVWGGYYGLFVRPRYLTDYRYLFSANAYTGVTLATLWPVLRDALFDGMWIGKTLFVLALAALAGSLAGLCFRRFRNPLAAALLLWIFGYAAFLAYHANLQPRYYLVLAVPLTMLVAVVFDAVLRGAIAAGSREQGTGNREQGTGNRVPIGAWALRLTAAVGGSALVFAAVGSARQTIFFVRHPEYTFLSAAGQIHDAVERELAANAGHSPLVLSISGADLSLMTGLPAICDDFGTMDLPQRIATYRPGWFASWNDVEDDKMEALDPMYRLVRVAAVPAFDDPERNLLILYRLDAVGSPGLPGRPGRRRSLSVPNRLRAKVGEQPSPVQLRH